MYVYILYGIERKHDDDADGVEVYSEYWVNEMLVVGWRAGL